MKDYNKGNKLFNSFLPSFVSKRREKFLDSIPKTVEESYKRDSESIRKDWEEVLGEFDYYKIHK